MHCGCCYCYCYCCRCRCCWRCSYRSCFCCYPFGLYCWKQGAGWWCTVVIVAIYHPLACSLPSVWTEHLLFVMTWKKSCVSLTSHDLTLWIMFFASRKATRTLVRGQFWKILVSSTKWMHLKVWEIYVKQLLFWEMKTGPVLHCCSSSSCCFAPSCSLTCVRNYVWLLLQFLSLLHFVLPLACSIWNWERGQSWTYSANLVLFLQTIKLFLAGQGWSSGKMKCVVLCVRQAINHLLFALLKGFLWCIGDNIYMVSKCNVFLPSADIVCCCLLLWADLLS